MTDLILNAEVSVVGSILISPGVIPLIRKIVKSSAFYSEPAMAIYEAACRLYDAGGAVDPVTIKRDAESHGHEIPSQYMMDCMKLTPTANNAEAYATILREEEMRRRIVIASEEAITKIRAGEAPKDVCVSLQSDIEAAVEQEKNDSLVMPDEAMIEFLGYRDKVQEGGLDSYIRTGYKVLDKLLGGGFVKEGFYVMAARPGIGKTTLGLQIADRVAAQGKHVLFVSLEMSINQLSAKRISVETGIQSGAILLGNLDEQDYDKVVTAAHTLSQRPLVFNRKPGATVSDVGFIAKQMKQCDFVVIDYLGIMQHESAKSLYESVTKTSNSLKRLARTLGIPILCLAQLNRNFTGKAGEVPKVSDLRDSGAIEQDADGVLLLHRTDVEQQDSYAPAELECIIGKNRHGATGTTRFNMYLTNGRIVQVGS